MCGPAEGLLVLGASGAVQELKKHCAYLLREGLLPGRDCQAQMVEAKYVSEAMPWLS